MTEGFTITVDGKPIEAAAGENLIDVARRAGALVPSLCHHRLLRPYGACRLCLVEITRDGRTRLTTSCNYEVLPDIEVVTDSEDIRRHRRMVLQLLLGLAPEALAVKGLARAAGVADAPFPPIPSPAGRADCIVCGLCARVCADVVGAAAITLSGRGERKGLEVPFRERIAEACIGCGACAAVCPTGAISMEDIAVEVLRRRPAADRPCRHALMGTMPGALCPNDYACARCEVDQRLVEACRPEHPIFAARGLMRPAGWED